MCKKENEKLSDKLLSIIVPVYCVEQYLEQCIVSIINQTYQNLEIILIDDGSPDKCPEICDRFTQIDSRIKVIHQKNMGSGEARNVGITIAKGDYIGFVDSDDYIHPQMYEILMELIINNSAEIAACTRLNFSDDDFGIEKYSMETIMDNYELFSGRMATKELLQSHTKFKHAMWEKIYNKNLFSNLKFRSVYAEDREITYKLLYQCEKVVYVDLKLYFYRLRNGSTMLSSWNEHKDDMVYSQDKECFNYFIECKDKELYNAAIFWHFLGGIENFRRLQNQDIKYRKRLIIEMKPYCSIKLLRNTDFSFRRKMEFYIFGKAPYFHYFICNCVRKYKEIKQ